MTTPMLPLAPEPDTDVTAADVAAYDEEESRAMRAMYGEDFPLAMENPTNDDWVAWARAIAESRDSAKALRLHYAARNRMFVDEDAQWISSPARGVWRTPRASADQARIVRNVMKPALNLRLNILTEQRPGFRTRPTKFDPRSQRRAEVQQDAIEYHYDEQRMGGINGRMREAAFWAQRDGASFLHVFWDPDAGPWREFGVPTGQFDENGVGVQDVRQMPVGDIRTRVYRMDQVSVSPNATASERPYWWTLRDEIPTGQAVEEHGDGVVTARAPGTTAPSGGGTWLRTADETERFADTETTDRIIVYCERTSFLPDGLMLVVVGDALVMPPSPLPTSKAGVVRFTDGSTDPAFFPPPIMEDWIGEQMQLNNAISKWVDAIRRGAGGQLMARAGAVSMDTLVAGLTRVIEVATQGPLAESAQWVNAPSIGADVKEFIALTQKAFEDKSGWNDASRGSFNADMSGRSILAQREAVERIFTPPIMAAADAMVEWAKHVLDYMRWGYDIPRTIALTGKGRSDLAREITAEDLDGISDVQIDPETLVPLPRAMRLFLLDQLYSKGAISLDEYRRRQPFAFIQNIDTPDRDHQSRARRVADAMRRVANGEPVPIPPMLWQDNEAIHQDTLEREIILDDDAPPMARQLADARWRELGMQQQMKMGGAPAVSPGAPSASRGNGKPATMSPQSQPMLGTMPGMASAPARLLAGGGDAQSTASTFDALNPQ